MRLAVYAGTSALVAAGALLKAFHQRPNFYSATVYLSQSNACVLILTNLALVCACTFIYGLQRIFYGPLRQIEIEQLTEKAWYAVLDTLLAMPSLSHDVSGWMLAIFVLLLAGKVWGWIGEGRVDILEQQPPQNPRVFHARLSSSLIVSVIFDVCLLQYCIKTVRDDPRPGMMVIFTFEFAILTIFSLFTLSRYVLALVEARILQTQTEQKIEERRSEIRAERERIQQEQAQVGSTGQTAPELPSDDDIDENEIDVPGWEEKRRWLFGLELATDFIKLIIYTVFFAISLTFMGLPMHIMRDVYLTFSAFAKRIQDYSNYRKATQNMNDRYSDATAQELENDNTCIVCREAMVPWEQPEAGDGNARRPTEGLRAKKLPCGHILHLRCLKAWLERQQACPTCRRPVISSQPSNPPAPGQPRIEGANAGPQPPGNIWPQPGAQRPANNAAPAPAPPAQRANRLRFLNLGPIRIGVYNGPAHQVQEALDQRDNARQQQAANTGAEPGPGAVGGDPAVLGTQSTQIQLMQVEERLIREARNLAIEQTQLLNVRALEAELARLRALHDRSQLGRLPVQAAALQGGMAGMAGAAGMQMPPTAANGWPQGPPQLPFGGGHAFPHAFQPLPGQAPLGAGHPDLPHGVTLPDGWSVTPLHRIDSSPPGVPISGASTGIINIPPAAASAGSAPIAPTLTSAAPTLSSTPEPRSSDAQEGFEQAAEDGSETVDQSQASNVVSTGTMQRPSVLSQAIPSSSPIVEPSSEPAAMSQANSQRSSILQSTPTPTVAPEGPAGWGFNDLDGQNESAATSSANGNAPGAESGSSDKGKGKAVTVEDVQDTE